MEAASSQAQAPAAAPAAPRPARRRSPGDAARFRGADIADPFIYTSKTVWMQRVTDTVRTGPPLYVTGRVPTEKVPRLLQKFAQRYVLNAKRMADSLARKSGKHVARWIGYERSPGEVHWILFYWPGKGDVCTEEKWRQTGKDRIEHSGYEVVRLTRPGAKAPALTWRYTREQYQNMRDEIIRLIRTRQDVLLEQRIHSLARTPGFAGAREQVKALWKLIRDEWKRSRKKTETPPAIPPTIGYVRRLPDKGALWSELMPQKKKRALRSNSEGV
jgi:hypothetical protein